MAAIEVQKFRVLELPIEAERVLGAEYWVRDQATGELTIHVVGKDSAAVVTKTISRADVEAMIGAMIESAKSATAERLEEELTLSTTAGSDVALSFTFAGDEGTVEAAATLKDVQTFDVGVDSKTYYKVTTDAKGRVLSGAEALVMADIPELDGTKITGELTNDTTGNAATATALETTRKIAGQDFDGTQNVVITAADVGAVALTDVGVTVAPLENGLVPSEFLPTYVDDVIEVGAYDQLPGQVNAIPENGPAEKGKIYLVVENTGTVELPVFTTKVYRWGGTVYVQIVDGVSMADQAVSLANTRSISAGGVGSDGTWTVSFNGTADVESAFTLADTAVTAGDYGFMVVDSKGRLTFARDLIMADIPELDYTVVKSAASLAIVDPAW